MRDPSADRVPTSGARRAWGISLTPELWRSTVPRALGNLTQPGWARAVRRALRPHITQRVVREDPVADLALGHPIKDPATAPEDARPAEKRLAFRSRQKGGIELARHRRILQTREGLDCEPESDVCRQDVGVPAHDSSGSLESPPKGHSNSASAIAELDHLQSESPAERVAAQQFLELFCLN